MRTGSADPYLLSPDAEITPEQFARGFHRLPRRGEPRCGTTMPPETQRKMERDGYGDDILVTDCILEAGHAPAGEQRPHNGLIVYGREMDAANPLTYSMYTWLSTRPLGHLVAR